MHLSIIYLISIYTSICISIFFSLYLSINLSIYFYFFLFLYVVIHFYIYISICLRGDVKKGGRFGSYVPGGGRGLGPDHNFWSKTTTFCCCFSIRIRKPSKRVKQKKKINMCFTTLSRMSCQIGCQADLFYRHYNSGGIKGKKSIIFSYEQKKKCPNKKW